MTIFVPEIGYARVFLGGGDSFDACECQMFGYEECPKTHISLRKLLDKACEFRL